MSEYHYTGRFFGGGAGSGDTSGQMRATTLDELRATLLGRGVILVSAQTVPGGWDRLKWRLTAGREITRSTRQLATLTSSGLSVAEAMEALAESSGHSHMAIAYQTLLKRLQEGERFAGALSEYPELFDRAYIALCEAGEASGKLPDILTRLAQHRERMDDLKRKFATALVYPTLVVVVSALVLIAVFKWVIPVFTDMYASFGAEMPPLTAFLVSMADWIGAHTEAILVGFVGIVTLGAWFYSRGSVRNWLHGLALKFPLLGKLWTKASIARYARTIGLLHSNGVTLLAAGDWK